VRFGKRIRRVVWYDLWGVETRSHATLDGEITLCLRRVGRKWRSQHILRDGESGCPRCDQVVAMIGDQKCSMRKGWDPGHPIMMIGADWIARFGLCSRKL
jgi:hypothetical protein